MTAKDQARIIAQISAEVSSEGLAFDLAMMATDRLKGQVPSQSLDCSAAQALADAAAKTAVSAVVGFPETAARDALERFKAGAAECVDFVFDAAKKEGLFS